MWRYIYFAFMEACTSIWRSRVLNLLSVGTIMFAMFILGSFIFVAINLKKITLDWQEQIQFNIFLNDDVLNDDLQKLRSFLEESFLVEKTLYISREDAKKRFEQDFSSYGDAITAIEHNPFPASFQVSLLKGVGDDSFDKLRKELISFKGIEEIYYDEEIFQRLSFFANLIQLSGWFFGSIMIFSSIFTISNVLKLTFFTRREEVDIMKLVGASRAYIRGPFIIEGVLIGFIGALASVLLVYLGYFLLNYYLTNEPGFVLSNLQVIFLPYKWVMFLILSGGLSGLLGSLFSLHQFLEEHISYQ